MAKWEKKDLKFVKGVDASISQWWNVPYDEMIKVVELLNKIPPSAGGPTTPIPLPNKNDPLLGFSPMAVLSEFFKAVEKFQRTQFGSMTDFGVLAPSSATLCRLANLAAAGDGSVFPVEGTLRAKVLQLADAEVNVVGDVGGGYTGDRRNWPELRRYFDESLIRPLPWNAGPSAWSPLKYTDKAGTTHQLKSMLEGVQGRGMRVPQSSTPEIRETTKPDGTRVKTEYWRGVSWCGIFANWAWQAAGVGTKWLMGGGPTVDGKKIATSTNLAAITPGDIVLKIGKENHHALVAVVQPGGKEFLTIDGNSFEAGVDQTVARHSLKASEVQGYYSLDSAMNGGRAAF